MIKLVVCDIDGTLVERDEVVPQDAISMKKELEARGVYFTLATGRVEDMADKFVKALDLSIPYVATNGATVVLGDNTIRRLSIPVMPLRSFIEKADELDMAIVYSINGHEWFWRDNSYLMSERERFDRYHEQHCFSEEEWKNTRIEKLSIFTDIYDDRISRLEEDAKLLGERFAYTRYIDRSIEIVDHNASKASGVEVLAKSLGIGMEEVMFCGDHQNDIELIEKAGLGIAVNNSTSDVKAVADYVCKGNCFHGVREAVDKFILEVSR